MRRALAIAACLLSLGAEARLVRESFEGVRPLGMGNAFLGLADDQNAVWYNPAALAWTKGGHFNLIDASLGVDSADTLSRIGAALFDGAYDNLLRNGTQNMRASLRPTIQFPYLAIAFFDHLQSFTDFRDLNTLDAAADVYTTNDIGAIVGVGIPFGPYFSAGASVRLFQRSAVDAFVDTQTLLADLGGIPPADFEQAIYDHLQSLAGMGYAYGMNLGVMAKIPVFPKGPEWNVSAVIEDVGRTKFYQLGSNTRLPPTLPMSYHLGTAFRWRLPRESEVNVAVDYRHVFGDYAFGQKLHVGVEYRHRFFDIRAGAYQVYPSFGFSLKFPPHTRVHFSTHAVEFGERPPERSQRFYQLQFIVGFSPI